MVPGRTARVLRRVGLAACAVIGLLYPAGYWWSANVVVPRTADLITLYVDAGQIRFNVVPDWMSGVSGPKRWEWRLSRTYPGPHLRWLPFATWGSGAAIIDIPLYVPLIVIATPTAMLWRRERLLRADPARCRACGYVRTGLATAAVCPECGAPARERSAIG